VTISLPPPRFQKTSAALSSDDRSIDSNDSMSSGDNRAPRSRRSSAMNSFTTEAMAMPRSLPLDTIWPVLRSLISKVMSAPASAACSVASRARSSSPTNAAAGWSGAASGRGARAP
jgi:hypothetical protein